MLRKCSPFRNQAKESRIPLHRIHFLVLEQNNEAAIRGYRGQFLDMIQVPFWGGTGLVSQCPVKMDFRLGAEMFVQMLFGARGATAIVQPVNVAGRAWR
jgi:hypothetical protein